MRLPDFIVIGAPKAGTTSLCSYLGANPQIYLSTVKEVNFFSRYFDKGTDWYADHFRDAQPDQIAGEGSPAYAMGKKSKSIAEKIASTIPEVKLIYCVRHPIRRIESHYLQDIDNGFAPTGVSTAVQQRDYFVETSKYFEILTSYLNYFPEDHIHILFLEDLLADPVSEINRCLRFLGASEVASVDFPKKGAREQMKKDYPIVRYLRWSGYFESIRMVMPAEVKNVLRRLLRKPLTQEELKVEWSQQVLEEVKEKICEDTKGFLVHTGKDPDFWSD